MLTKGVLQNILLSMISKDNGLLLKTVSVCSRNTKYIGGLLDITGKLATLNSTNVLLKNLLLIAEEMLEQDPEKIDFDPEVHTSQQGCCDIREVLGR